MYLEIDAKNKFKFKIKNKVKFGDTHSHSHEHWHDHGHNSGSNFNECEAEYKSEDWRGNKEEIEEGKVICPIGVNTCVKFKCDTIGFKCNKKIKCENSYIKFCSDKYKGCGTCSDVYFELAKNGKTRFELDRLGCTCEGIMLNPKNIFLNLISRKLCQNQE